MDTFLQQFDEKHVTKPQNFLRACGAAIRTSNKAFLMRKKTMMHFGTAIAVPQTVRKPDFGTAIAVPKSLWYGSESKKKTLLWNNISINRDK